MRRVVFFVGLFCLTCLQSPDWNLYMPPKKSLRSSSKKLIHTESSEDSMGWQIVQCCSRQCMEYLTWINKICQLYWQFQEEPDDIPVQNCVFIYYCDHWCDITLLTIYLFCCCCKSVMSAFLGGYPRYKTSLVLLLHWMWCELCFMCLRGQIKVRFSQLSSE